MKKLALLFSITLAILSLLIMGSCKTTDEDTIVNDFSIENTSGYSLQATVIPKNQNQENKILTSINLYAAIRNHTNVTGTITSWSFKIKRDIVTILEINQNNYQNYKLTISGGMVVPGDDIIEIFIGTPQPFLTNALADDVFIFNPYIPTQIIAEMTISDQNGNLHEITASGSYTFEETTINED
ncbi:MAG: hypothetical protein KAS65_00540 [Candidatus Aminicenantes bacterium]|nr:hypothetical protein [Candidatus Aminicenantes bacterium]